WCVQSHFLVVSHYALNWTLRSILFFFFQAEDGIRDATVTGVQTCALPISARRLRRFGRAAHERHRSPPARDSSERDEGGVQHGKIGRASCRERGVDLGGRRIV